MNVIRTLVYFSPIVPIAYSVNGMIAHPRDRVNAFYNFGASLCFFVVYKKFFKNPIQTLKPLDFDVPPRRLQSIFSIDNLPIILPTAYLAQSLILKKKPEDLKPIRQPTPNTSILASK